MKLFTTLSFFFLLTAALHASAPPSNTAITPSTKVTYQWLDYKITLEKGVAPKKPNVDGMNIETTDRLTVTKGTKAVKELEKRTLTLDSLGYRQFQGDTEPRAYLVVGSHSGGAHCCSGITTFQLTPTFKEVFAFEGDGNVNTKSFAPEAKTYIEITDPAFLYWHGPYATSAFVTIPLEKGPQGLQVCQDCPRQHMDERAIRGLAEKISEDKQLWQNAARMSKTDWPDGFYPGEVVQVVADLTYANKAALAEEFLDRAWPKDSPLKDKFKKDFRELMVKNPYWIPLGKKGYKLPFETQK